MTKQKNRKKKRKSLTLLINIYMIMIYIYIYIYISDFITNFILNTYVFLVESACVVTKIR